MKNILSLILSIFLFSSCSSTYFFATLDSHTEGVEKVENGDFLLETDSLWVAYCFKGANAPVQITAFNKSDVPLYIDWNKSALIIDGMTITYAGDRLNYSEEEWRGEGSSVSRNVSVAVSDNTTFIPPNSMVSEVPLYLSPNFEKIDKKDYRRSSLGNRYSESIPVERINFDESNTPLKFKSYLTIYAKPENPMVFEQDFYMVNLIKTEVRPNDLADNLVDRGDLFYVEKPANNTAVYTTLGIIGATGLVVLGVLYGDPTGYDYVDDDY